MEAAFPYEFITHLSERNVVRLHHYLHIGLGDNCVGSLWITLGDFHAFEGQLEIWTP